jgi:hypothetical protein
LQLQPLCVQGPCAAGAGDRLRMCRELLSVRARVPVRQRLRLLAKRAGRGPLHHGAAAACAEGSAARVCVCVWGADAAHARRE